MIRPASVPSLQAQYFSFGLTPFLCDRIKAAARPKPPTHPGHQQTPRSVVGSEGSAGGSRGQVGGQRLGRRRRNRLEPCFDCSAYPFASPVRPPIRRTCSPVNEQVMRTGEANTFLDHPSARGSAPWTETRRKPRGRNSASSSAFALAASRAKALSIELARRDGRLLGFAGVLSSPFLAITRLRRAAISGQVSGVWR